MIGTFSSLLCVQSPPLTLSHVPGAVRRVRVLVDFLFIHLDQAPDYSQFRIFIAFRRTAIFPPQQES